MSNQFKRLFVGSKIKTVGDCALYRFEDETPTAGVSYWAYSGSGTSSYATCAGVTTTRYYNEVIVAHIYGGKLVVEILKEAFKDQTVLTTVVLPETIITIGDRAFSGCTQLSSLTFLGTKAQWKAIRFGSSWNSGCTALTNVHCSDGDVAITL